MWGMVALRDAGMMAQSRMIADRPVTGRPEAGFMRRFLLVLLAAFALAEFPAGAREFFGPSGLAALVDERRLGEPFERKSLQATTADASDGFSAESFARLDIQGCDDADPVAAGPVDGPPQPLPGLSAKGLAAPAAAPVPPPCRGIRSRAPPALA